MRNWQDLALGVLFGLLGAGLILLASSQPDGIPIKLLPPPTPAPILIHVAGEVNKPGVYALPTGSRVLDAVQEAGGFTDDADRNGLNLAAQLQDGEKFRVPSLILVPESKNPSGFEEENGDQRFIPVFEALININTATREELESLPEIGPTKAEKIITYRQTEGFFESIEDIQKVDGIGPTTYEEIKGLITVNEY